MKIRERRCLFVRENEKKTKTEKGEEFIFRVGEGTDNVTELKRRERRKRNAGSVSEENSVQVEKRERNV